MRIALGSDHRGYEKRLKIVDFLRHLGHDPLDLGVFVREACDYPDFAFQVAFAVSEGRADRGILVCGTGIGMCIAANKVPGVRAALCCDIITAEMSRRHNDANVLCLSGDLLGDEVVQRMVRVWLETPFEGGRHARRLEKIARFEQEHWCRSSPAQSRGGQLPNGPSNADRRRYESLPPSMSD
ncbi:MAG: ribose 5-phosphate isomerase B [Gemmatales bacterium]|nr:ribose 5-phosphate isomerase B [Gemmatales bacterium]MDW8174634.1 ribose 5-phosphate isomerase B [Gemmatales bacterium]